MVKIISKGEVVMDEYQKIWEGARENCLCYNNVPYTAYCSIKQDDCDEYENCPLVFWIELLTRK